MPNYVDLVSCYLLVIESTNKYNVGIKGHCIYETKNMLYIQYENSSIKKVMKAHSIFKVVTGNEVYILNGFQINNKVYKRNYIIS